MVRYYVLYFDLAFNSPCTTGCACVVSREWYKRHHAIYTACFVPGSLTHVTRDLSVLHYGII